MTANEDMKKCKVYIDHICSNECSKNVYKRWMEIKDNVLLSLISSVRFALFSNSNNPSHQLPAN